MGSEPSYRRDTNPSGRQSTQTVKNTIYRLVSCRKLLEIFDDDENLAWADEAELASGSRLQGGGIFLKTPRLVAKRRVLLLEPFHAVGGEAQLLASLDGPGKAMIAQQPVHEQRAAEKNQEPANPARLAAPPHDRESLNAVVFA
jgi:hypothetical protein